MIMTTIECNDIHLKPLNIPEGWEAQWNHFLDLEPDNTFAIEETWFYFMEDIAYFGFKNSMNEDYFIDLGFYGVYSNNREGTFILYIAQGDFIEGTIYECFESRSTDEIKQKIELYMDLIATGKIKNYKGLPFNFNQEGCIPSDKFIFSSVEGIKKRRVFD